MNRKGFKLTELLAVIVILVIIALIATLVILNNINSASSAREKVKQRSAELVYTGVQYAYIYAMHRSIEGTYIANPGLEYIKQYLNVDNVDKENKVKFDNDETPTMLKIDTDDGVYCEVTIENGLQVSCYSSTEKENAKHYFTKSVQTNSESGEDNDTIVQESPKEWFTYDETTGTITGFSYVWNNLEDDSKYDIIIPSTTPNGNSIVNVGRGSFSSKSLKSVKIPDSVITIEDAAFFQNNITSLDLGDNVKTIGPAAFNANKLESVKIPDSVQIIDSTAFFKNNIINLDLGKGVQKIGQAAFYGNKLEHVVIPTSVIKIDSSAFNSNNITSLDLSEGIQTIGDSAFKNNKLEYIKIPRSVTLLSEVFAYNNLITVELESSVQIIGYRTFHKGILYRNDNNISNPNLTTIINKTGREYDWASVIGSTLGEYTFKTGIVENDYGNIIVTDTN